MTAAPPRVPLAAGWSLWPMAALRGAGMPFELVARFAAPDLLARPPGEERNAALRRAASDAAAEAVLDDGVREALVWQNPQVVDTWLGDYAARLATGGPARLSNRANRESLIARYAQRYCAKNESIGFFGPVAWARWSPDARGLVQEGGGGLPRRTVHLETWAIAALADSWREDDELFPHLPVRLDPVHSFEGGELWRPRRPPVRCEPLTADLLRAVDGRRSCGEVLAAAGTGTLVERRAELLRLHRQGVLQLGFRVPFDHCPEQHLRAQVARLPDNRVRSDLLQRLDDVSAARDAVQRSSGPEPVRSALHELSRRLWKAGMPESAGAGRVYGRTIAYLDCRRDTDVRLGGDLLDSLRGPLGVLLDSARWLSGEVAAGAERGLRRRYRWLRERREVVLLSDLLLTAGDLMSADGPLRAEVLPDFQLRWAEVLSAAAKDPSGHLRLGTATVRPITDVLFPVPERGWAAARQHSPDLLLGRAADGTLQWVLGELHVALNTLESRVFVTQADDPDAMVARTAADLPHGRVVPLYPLTAAEASPRTYPPPALDPPGHYRYWSYDTDPGHPDGVASVAGTQVVVTEQDGVLVGRPRGQAWDAPVLEFFGEFLTAVAVDLFQLRAPRPHLPRVLLDDVVIGRESWTVPVTDVPVPGRRNTDRGHQAVRDWAADLGMPRHLFVRTPARRKPIYVDLAAPLLVGNFVRAVRRELTAPPPGAQPATVSMVEMLPTPDELWLTDARGRRYTAEFRVVAVDGEPARPVTRQTPAEARHDG